MEVVVAATVAEAALAVVHGDCDGGDFGEVERRRGGGVRMMMAAVCEGGGWLWRGVDEGGGDWPESGRNLAGTRERRRKILEREKFTSLTSSFLRLHFMPCMWCSQILRVDTTAPNSIHYARCYNKLLSFPILQNFVSIRNTYCLLIQAIIVWLSINQSIQILTSKLPSPMGIKAMFKGVSKGNGYIKKDKNEAKTDKTKHEIGRVQEIEAEGVYIFKWANPYPFNGPAKLNKIFTLKHSKSHNKLLDDKPKRDGLIGLYQLVFNKLELVDELLEHLCPCLRKGQGTDISKITRKPSKTGKHGHEKRKSTKEARDAKPRAGSKVKKSTLVNFQSNLGQ
ncbi:hypothetical protein Tco_0848984 [Tanacetum coccineum]